MAIEQPSIKVFIIIGISGAGKSTALQVFEDLGYFTVDGLPMALVQEMVCLMKRDSMSHFKGIALGISLQGENIAHDMQVTMQNILSQGLEPYIIFLESQVAELMRRYATTRRPHPFERHGMGLESALESERNYLAHLRDIAHTIIDTSQFSIHDLRRTLQERWGRGHHSLRILKVNIITFGFKYGIPREADFVFDLRFLPNPYFDKSLRDFSGLDDKIVKYIFEREAEQEFLKKFMEFMLVTLERVAHEGRYRLTLALGCTGGRHRSVATAERIFKVIKQAGYVAFLEHRHLGLG